MKRLFENWKRYLEEDQVYEAALGMGKGGLAELGDMVFEIEKDGEDYIIHAKNGEQYLGEVVLDSQHLNCGIYMTHSGIDNPKSGKFGPFLYDLAIEFGSILETGVTSSHAPSGIRDENAESKKTYAINVWTYYYNKRTDVRKFPITCLAMIENRKLQFGNNYIYPNHGQAHLHKQRRKIKDPPKSLQNHVNAINHVYSKDPIYLNALKKAGKLQASDEIMDEIF